MASIWRVGYLVFLVALAVRLPHLTSLRHAEVDAALPEVASLSEAPPAFRSSFRSERTVETLFGLREAQRQFTRWGAPVAGAIIAASVAVIAGLIHGPGRWHGAIAGLLAIFSPGIWLRSTLLKHPLEPTSYGLLTAATAFALHTYSDTANTWWSMAAGAVLGAALGVLPPLEVAAWCVTLTAFLLASRRSTRALELFVITLALSRNWAGGQLSGELVGALCVTMLCHANRLRVMIRKGIAHGLDFLVAPVALSLLWSTGALASVRLQSWPALAVGAGVKWDAVFRELHVLSVLFPAGVYYTVQQQTRISFGAAVFGMGSLVMAVITGNVTWLRLAAPILIATITVPLQLWKFDTKGKATWKVREMVPSSYVQGAVLLLVTGVLIFIANSILVVARDIRYAHPLPVVTDAYSSLVRMQFEIDDAREAAAWLRLTMTNAGNDTGIRLLAWNAFTQYPTAALLPASLLAGTADRRLAALAFTSNITRAHAHLRASGYTHVVTQFGGYIGYPRDDIGQVPDMLALLNSAPGTGPHRTRGRPTDEALVYRLGYADFGKAMTRIGAAAGYDVARDRVATQQAITGTSVESEGFRECFTSSHWLYRIYELVDIPEPIE